MNAEVLTTADKERRHREQQRAKEEGRQADGGKPPIARAKSAPASSKAGSSNVASPRP